MDWLTPFIRQLADLGRWAPVIFIAVYVVASIVLAFFVFRKPTYLTELMASSWGRNSTILAVCLEIIGAIWIMQILKSSEQS